MVGVEMSMSLPPRGGHFLAPLTAGRREARGQDGEVNRYVFLSAAVTTWRRSRPTAERLVVGVEMSIHPTQRGGHLPALLTVGHREASGRGGDARAGNEGLTVVRKKSSGGGRRE